MKLFTLLFCLLLCNRGFSQTTYGDLRGFVIDFESKEHCTGSKLYLYKGGALIASKVSAADGSFNFTPLDPDSNYILVSEKPGYDTLEVYHIDIIADQITFQNVRMRLSWEQHPRRLSIEAKKPVIDNQSRYKRCRE